MLLTKDGSQLKTALLVIGIVPFFVTSLLATIEDIPTEEYDLCRTLRMGDWQVLYETIIRGRMSAALDAIIVNFAVAWMMITSVESLSQSEGGLGTLILKFNKAHDIAAVFAVMINIFVLGLAVDKFLKYAKGVFFPHTKFK
jgi:NitT/TauT family transport system permease protein